jgi:hypothetical protein
MASRMAVDGESTHHIGALRHVEFVTKGDTVYRSLERVQR